MLYSTEYISRSYHPLIIKTKWAVRYRRQQNKKIEYKINLIGVSRICPNAYVRIHPQI